MTDSSTLPKARILIVDDHPNTASMLARALGQLKNPTHVMIALTGQEALEMIGNDPVDVLITDFIMPGMNGLELVEKLQGEREPAHTILITAYDSPGLAATARRLKVNDYLVKPVQPEKILTIVGRVLDGLHPIQPATAAQAVVTHEQFNILIADDRPDNLHLLATRLSSEGYAFITAADGEETLQKLRAATPDLLLLDVNMPKKDGFEVLKEMRTDPRIAHIPVIVITAARIEPKDVRFGFGLGADDYITKPFDWRELAARVRAKLRVKRAEDALRRRNRELGLLPDIGQDLSARLDVEELAGITLQRTVQALGATDGYLIIFEPEGRIHYEFYTPRKDSVEIEEAKKRIVSEGIIAHVVAHRQTITLEDTKNDPRWIELDGGNIRSAIAVPLISRRSVLGALALTHNSVGYFNQDHISLMQAIASQASIAIENAQLYYVEHKRVKELVAINQITREISLFTASAELFERTPQLIQALLGYPVVSLWLTAGDTLTLRSCADTSKDLPHSMLMLTPQQVARTGQPAQTSGTMEGDASQRVVQSAIAVPLFWEAKMSGVIAIHHARPGAFQESDHVLLETLAAQIAGALERIRLFESVEQEQRRLKAVLNSAADAILVTDSNGRLQLVNPAGELLFTDVETKLGHALPPNRGYDELIRLLEQSIQSGNAVQNEIGWPDKRTFSTLVTPIEEGGQVAVLHDVSHFKDLDRVKNEFIATATHDLKNPLTSVLGYTQLMEKAGSLTPQQAEFIKRIQLAANHMNELIQNLIELARIDLGIESKHEKCNFVELVAGVADEFKVQAAAKSQTLAIIPTDERPLLKVDPVRLRQVLRNLIGNAVKYTPEGGQVTVSTEIEKNMVNVKIKDTGIGIAANDLPYIFDKFYRARGDETKDIEGNGLGLAIVKAVVEQHSGKISVESTPGEGSCFSVALPI